MGGGSCPTGYNLLGQLTGQLRELVEWAATQQITIWAANLNLLGQPTDQPMTIVRMGSCPTDYC